MRAFVFVTIILIAASAVFAETITSQYVAGDWLSVTRTVTSTADDDICLDSHGITDACAAGGAIQPNYGTTSTKTQVTLSVENVGPVDRTGVDLTEDLSYVPAGAKTTFSPLPSSSDGRSATWTMGTLAKGAIQQFTYEISARVPPATLSAIPDVAVAADPAVVSLEAPYTIKSGEKVSAVVKSAAGKPLSNTIVIVTYPDGIKHPLRSDIYGMIKFTAADEGTYKYSLEGYSLSEEASTEAEPVQQIPSAPVAAAVDTGLASSIMGVLPILAAIFAIAVIALILYNFFTSRRADEDEYLPSNAPAQPGMAYTQKFTFGQDAKDDRKLRERTHDILESRKKHLAETAAAAGSTGEEEGTAVDESAESTATDEDMASILSELEHKARNTGEVAHEEESEEVERTISELEAIREKLRAMRSKGKGAATEGAEAYEGEAASETEEPEASGEEGGEEETSEAEAPEKEEAAGAEEEEATESPEPEAEEAEETEEPEEEKPVRKAASKKVIYGKRVQPKVKPVAKGKKMRFGNRGVKKK